ncbi:MAG: type IV toxin-antitoxin system AbiEi family antitoxin [Saprospiraceae bacterium]
MLETDILHAAIEQLEQMTQAKIEVETTSGVNGHHWDAEIDIATGAANGHFKVEVKGNVLPANLARWADKLLEANTLLVAKYISNPAKALLVQQGINYLDMAGNCFIRNDQGIFWHVKGQSAPTNDGITKHRAFNKNGIKLIYALLLNEGLLNEPYRVMAEAANIAASTVGDILNDLQAGKFLVQLNEQQMKLVNKEELLGQWVTAFNQKLRPKLSRGKYRLPFENWKQLDLGSFAYWGGEPAADLLTHYLSPGAWTLYTDLDRKALIRDLRLVSDPKGNLEVCSLFWNIEDNGYVMPDLKTVHPLLVYAELIGSGNDRNFETARKIYVQYLQDIIEQGN